MDLQILQEAGYEEALMGMAFSYEVEKDYLPVIALVSNKIKKRAQHLAFKGGGHNKFLEQMQVWLCIRAPMYWWKQMDTYRLCSKSSKSTMHTLMKRSLTVDDFTDTTSFETIYFINTLIADKKFERVIAELPMGFLQTRLVNVSYKTLQNIVSQRKGHKIEEWNFFINEILINIKHPEFLWNTTNLGE